jgi:hypothetical protein
MGIERKSLGMLIDELITTSMKCWFAQEQVMKGVSDMDVAGSAATAQRLNKRRNELISAIDRVLGDEDITPTEKTY